MNLDFTEAQQMFRTAVRSFLATECPKKKVRELEESDRGHDPELWKKIADLGWIGLGIPERYGGSGAEFTTLLVLVEETGRNIFPSPLFSTAVLGALPLVQYGSEALKQEFLPRIARGEAILTLALLRTVGQLRAFGNQNGGQAGGCGIRHQLHEAIRERCRSRSRAWPRPRRARSGWPSPSRPIPS